MLNTLQEGLSVFSDEEMNNIRSNPEVDKVASFTSNLFQASAYTDGGANGKFFPFQTDLFFEALPDEFVDVKTGAWHWSEGQKDVPIIVPNDYINLYNFGFAPSQGLPQLSKGTIQLANFVVKIEGRGKLATFTGHIVGFTDRINSILVPQTFIDYANKNYGDNESFGPSRLVLVSKNADNSQLVKFITDNGYETNTEDQRNSKFFAIVNIIFSIVLVIGALIVVMGLLGFIQYSQLLIAKSDYELKTLLQLGYKHQTLSKTYMNYFTKVYGILFVSSIIIVIAVKFKLNVMLQLSGFDADEIINYKTILFGIAISCILLLVNVSVARRSVKSLA